MDYIPDYELLQILMLWAIADVFWCRKKKKEQQNSNKFWFSVLILWYLLAGGTLDISQNREVISYTSKARQNLWRKAKRWSVAFFGLVTLAAVVFIKCFVYFIWLWSMVQQLCFSLFLNRVSKGNRKIPEYRQWGVYLSKWSHNQVITMSVREEMQLDNYKM